MATFHLEPAVQQQAPSAPAPIPFPTGIFPWKPRVVPEMTILFGPLAGAIVTALTLKRLNEARKGLWTLAGGVLVSLVVTYIAYHATWQGALVLGAIVQIGAALLYLHLQSDPFENWELRFATARARSEWSALGWAVLGLVLMVLLVPVVNSNVRAGMEYRIAQYRAGTNPAAAASWYRWAADLGHGLARNDLGAAYETGAGVAMNPQEAVHWYRLAAEQGTAAAQFNLGRAYRQGLGVAANPATAVTWLEKAADQGYEPALYLLGSMYEQGEGVRADDAKAVAIYRKSAERGYAPAQVRLGTLYALGQGVRPDPNEARLWWNKAAEQGDAGALLMLGSMALDQGDRVLGYTWISLIPSGDPQYTTAQATVKALEEQMSSAEVQDAKRRAQAWLSQHRRP